MKKWIIANFKMYKTIEESVIYANEIKELVAECKNKVVICPPYTSIKDMADVFQGTDIQVGAQNCATELEGAYTGEVSARMLENAGAKLVILGHSERRRYYGETDEIIGAKINQVLKAGLTPVVCLADAGGSDFEETIKKQLDVLFKNVDSTNIILAFEPVWAIGTGKTMATEEIEPALAKIKSIAKLHLGYMPEVLYGGSVNALNAKEILDLKSVGGLLVGGASKNPLDFSRVCLADSNS